MDLFHEGFIPVEAWQSASTGMNAASNMNHVFELLYQSNRSLFWQLFTLWMLSIMSKWGSVVGVSRREGMAQGQY